MEASEHVSRENGAISIAAFDTSTSEDDAVENFWPGSVVLGSVKNFCIRSQRSIRSSVLTQLRINLHIKVRAKIGQAINAV
jgi:hypothetical protein